MEELYLFEDAVIRLHENFKSECKEFAAKLDYSYYIKKRRADPKKVQYQCYYSKLVEFAISSFLNDKFGPCTLPVTQIYKAKDKSWDSDLLLGVGGVAYKVHCKSWSSDTAERYGASASFNISNSRGRGGLDNLFQDRDPKDYIAFAEFNEDDESVKIMALAKWSLLREKDVFREPVVHQLRGLKMVVYLDDLKNLSREALGEGCNNVF